MELDRCGEVWSVYDPHQAEEVLFKTVEDALEFVRLMTADLELGDVIRIEFKAIRVMQPSDVKQ